MLMCNEQVTLVQCMHCADDDQYINIAINGASWFAKSVIDNQEKGLRTANILQCRIPASALPDGVKPCAGDYLVRGVLGQVIHAPQDFAQMEYFKITAVGDNRRGKLQHWRVTGA